MATLKNFYIQCVCGQDHKITDSGKLRKCSCGKEIKVSKTTLRYLKAKKLALSQTSSKRVI